MLSDKVKLELCVSSLLRGLGVRTLSDEGQVILYRCVKCGAIVKSTELKLGIRCPHCRYRVLMKEKPPIVRRIKAE